MTPRWPPHARQRERPVAGRPEGTCYGCPATLLQLGQRTPSTRKAASAHEHDALPDWPARRVQRLRWRDATSWRPARGPTAGRRAPQALRRADGRHHPCTEACRERRPLPQSRCRAASKAVARPPSRLVGPAGRPQLLRRTQPGSAGGARRTFSVRLATRGAPRGPCSAALPQSPLGGPRARRLHPPEPLGRNFEGA